MAGHYRKRGKDSYELTYRGKSRTVKAGSDREVERALAAFIVEVDSGKFRRPTTLTVKQFIEERWMRDYVNVNLAPGTMNVYKIYINSRIIPLLGHLKLDKVKPVDLLDFYSNLKEDGVREDKKPGALSPATIQKYHHILSSMFRCAVEWQFIDDNPASRVKPGKIPKKRPFSLDEQQTATLFSALANEPLKYRVLATLAIFTGLRRGELLGLTWANVNLEQNIIRVEQTSQHISGIGIYQKDPKTDMSKRVVAIPKSLNPLLERHRAEQLKQQSKHSDKWVENDLLFRQWNGKPMHPNTVDNWINKFKEDNSLPDELTFHGLRHTAATMMIIHGIDIGTVAKNLGHAKPSTTTDIYYASLLSATRVEPEKMDELFGLHLPNLLDKPVNTHRKNPRP